MGIVSSGPIRDKYYDAHWTNLSGVYYLQHQVDQQEREHKPEDVITDVVGLAHVLQPIRF